MERKIFLLYKDMHVGSIDESDIYKYLKKDKKTIKYVLLPVDNNDIEYIRINPSNFIKKFKQVIFEYDLNGINYAQSCDMWYGVNLQHNKVVCNTPIELYSFLYSLDKLESFNALYTDNEPDDFFELTISNVYVKFESNKGKVKRINLTHLGYDNSSDDGIYVAAADVEGIATVVSDIKDFFMHTVMDDISNLFESSRDFVMYINREGSWGYREIEHVILKSSKSLDKKCPFPILKYKEADPLTVYDYMESVPGIYFNNISLVYPEDMALLELIDKAELSIVNIAYMCSPENFPYDLKICCDSVYNDTSTLEYFEIIGMDMCQNLYDAPNIMETIIHARYIYSCLMILGELGTGKEVDDVLMEFVLYPKGFHPYPFTYPICKDLYNSKVDIYKDLIKKLRIYLLELGVI